MQSERRLLKRAHYQADKFQKRWAPFNSAYKWKKFVAVEKQSQISNGNTKKFQILMLLYYSYLPNIKRSFRIIASLTIKPNRICVNRKKNNFSNVKSFHTYPHLRTLTKRTVIHQLFWRRITKWYWLADTSRSIRVHSRYTRDEKCAVETSCRKNNVK